MSPSPPLDWMGTFPIERNIGFSDILIGIAVAIPIVSENPCLPLAYYQKQIGNNNA
jgi:hypothetical protein